MSSAARYRRDTNADFCGVNGILGNFVGILFYVTGRITSLTSQLLAVLRCLMYYVYTKDYSHNEN